MQNKECTYNQAARTLVGLGLRNAPLAESDTGFSFLWLIVLGTADALEVPLEGLSWLKADFPLLTDGEELR